jgi:hypothetical protein
LAGSGLMLTGPEVFRLCPAGTAAPSYAARLANRRGRALASLPRPPARALRPAQVRPGRKLPMAPSCSRRVGARRPMLAAVRHGGSPGHAWHQAALKNTQNLTPCRTGMGQRGAPAALRRPSPLAGPLPGVLMTDYDRAVRSAPLVVSRNPLDSLSAHGGSSRTRSTWSVAAVTVAQSAWSTSIAALVSPPRSGSPSALTSFDQVLCAGVARVRRAPMTQGLTRDGELARRRFSVLNRAPLCTMCGPTRNGPATGVPSVYRASTGKRVAFERVTLAPGGCWPMSNQHPRRTTCAPDVRVRDYP